MLPAEQAGCWSGKTAVEAMRRLWMFFTARREQRRMWMEEEEETDRRCVRGQTRQEKSESLKAR
jgi:hypothetical protein